jgi:hypothetical protein
MDIQDLHLVAVHGTAYRSTSQVRVTVYVANVASPDSLRIILF